jgi:cytoskeletal protein CcmA (bactofilin family)
MWNRRKEEFTPKPTAAPPTSSELAKEGIPMSTLPTRAVEPHHDTTRGGGGAAVLGKSVIVKGQIYGREDLTIDGEVEGTVELQEHRLTIGPNGKVLATVKAREVVVLGTVHGNVETRDKIQIRKDAKLVGDIKPARIEIEDGAYFKGHIDIVRTEAKPAAAPVPKPQAVAPAMTSTAASGAPGANSAPAAAASATDNKR